MKPEDILLRIATLGDAAELLDIYAYYVKNTAITFEYEVPTPGEFRERMATVLKKHPYIVAESGGELLGYAYTGAFVGRAAYAWSAETTIYLRKDCKKSGLGKKLYTALEDISRAQHILNLNACVAYPQTDDEYLTRNSVQFHEHLGYRVVGEFRQCSYKFGRWYDMVWLEKLLGAHEPQPDPVIPFPQLGAEALRALGVIYPQ